MIIDGSFDDPKNLCRRMHDEVRVVADSPRLSALTARTVGKALQLMAEKAEYMTFAGMLSQLCHSSLYFGVLNLVPRKKVTPTIAMHVSEACQAHKSSALQCIKALAGLQLCACLSLTMNWLAQCICPSL